MSKQDNLIDRYISVVRDLYGDAVADRTKITYSRGWFTLVEPLDHDAKNADDESKHRESALMGMVDSLEQTQLSKSYPKGLAPVSTADDNGEPFGFLTWWTIHQGNRDIEELSQQADAAGLPDWVSGDLVGASPEAAWRRATQLGARGVVSADDEDRFSRYLVRDAGQGVRLLIRETVDEAGLQVGIEHIGVITLKNSGVGFEADPSGTYATRRTEVDPILTKMDEELYERTGSIDDGRIRNILLRWLERRYRVCVRGTGGVYFVPNPADKDMSDDLKREIISMRRWVEESKIGRFTVTALYRGGMTTVEDFQESAISDLEDELQDIYDKLGEWENNQKMNAGSRMYSAGQMMERMGPISDKMEALAESLGERIAIVQLSYDRVHKAALEMQNSASGVVEAARKERRKQQEAAREERKREAARKKEEKSSGGEKKTGTAKQRKAKKLA